MALVDVLERKYSNRDDDRFVDGESHLRLGLRQMVSGIFCEQANFWISSSVPVSRTDKKAVILWLPYFYFSLTPQLPVACGANTK